MKIKATNLHSSLTYCDNNQTGQPHESRQASTVKGGHKCNYAVTILVPLKIDF